MLKRFAPLFLTLVTLTSAAVAQQPTPSPSPSPQPSNSPAPIPQPATSPAPTPQPATSPAPSPQPVVQNAPVSQYAAFVSSGGLTTMEDISLACAIADPNRNQAFAYSTIVNGVFYNGTITVGSKECGTPQGSDRVIRGQFIDRATDSTKGCRGNITVRVSNSNNQAIATWEVTNEIDSNQCGNKGKVLTVNLRRNPWTATDTCRKVTTANNSTANLRWTPEGPVRDQVNNGSEVVEYGRSEGWSFVSNRGIQGYIDSSILGACQR